jgi:hypothetical protein
MGQILERVWFLGSKAQWLVAHLKDEEEKVKELDE